LANLELLYRDINLLIMDYLVNEGYPITAKKFADEANIPPPPVSSETIQERVEIRNAILGGQIQTAIEKINDLNPQVRPTQETSTRLRPRFV
jgi:hypothetical protein